MAPPRVRVSVGLGQNSKKWRQQLLHGAVQGPCLGRLGQPGQNGASSSCLAPPRVRVSVGLGQNSQKWRQQLLHGAVQGPSLGGSWSPQSKWRQQLLPGAAPGPRLGEAWSEQSTKNPCWLVTLCLTGIMLVLLRCVRGMASAVSGAGGFRRQSFRVPAVCVTV